MFPDRAFSFSRLFLTDTLTGLDCVRISATGILPMTLCTFRTPVFL